MQGKKTRRRRQWGDGHCQEVEKRAKNKIQVGGLVDWSREEPGRVGSRWQEKVEEMAEEMVEEIVEEMAEEMVEEVVEKMVEEARRGEEGVW